MSGWYAVKRGTIEHELFAPVGKWSRFEAWSWMVENAAFRATVIDIGGKPYTVPRGALCFSQRFLAFKFKWSKKALTSFLEKLESHGAIEISVAKTGTGTRSKRTQITLCNYDKYQSAGAKTEPKGDQKGTKEEQGNKDYTLEPNGSSDAEASISQPISISVITSALWDVGPRYLISKGVPEKQARAVIGRWRKDHQDVAILSAIEAAQKAGTQDPVPYITEALKPQGSVQVDMDAILRKAMGDA